MPLPDDPDHTTKTLVLDDLVVEDLVLDHPSRDTDAPPVQPTARLVCVLDDLEDSYLLFIREATRP